jgi:polar amino acid transport system permease protein
MIKMRIPSDPNDPFANQPLSEKLWLRFRNAPWWAIILVLILIYAWIEIFSSDSRRDILDNMLDQPTRSTLDKFDVVYEVDTDVLVINERVSLILADGSRLTIDAEDVVSRVEGTLACDKEVDPNCIDQSGEIATYRAPVPEGGIPDGSIERRGLLRPIGNAVEQSNGELVIVSPEYILSTEEGGVLECDRVADPLCQDKTGTIVTYQVPYVLQTALVARDDITIQHEDGYRETVRPNRIKSIRKDECNRADQPFCENGEMQIAVFIERIIGTETAQEGDRITVRTVDEVKVLIPRERIISMEPGLVECDKEANPRCQDFEGTIVERRGAITRGELTLENNRSLSIIPEGEATAIEISKSRVVGEVRTPDDCRVEDEGVCLIEVKEADDVVAGRIVADTEAGITVQTVEPVFVTIDKNHAVATRRAPQVCALNNIRGCNAGVWLTLMVTIVSYSLALMIGLVVGLMRVSANPILYHLSTLYVEVIRGTPLLVLLLFFAFVVGPLMRDSGIGVIVSFYRTINAVEKAVLGEENFLAEAVLGLAIGYGAFLAEIFRAGIQSIGKGQMEAARSLGMTYPQAMRKVILPQAIRVILPPLGNDFIAMLKDSALISVLALPDLLQMGRLYITRTFQPIPVYVVVALLYIVMTLILSMGVRTLERRFKLP